MLCKSGFPPNPSPSLFHCLLPPLTRNCVMTVRNPLHRRTRPGALGDVPCAVIFLGPTFPTSDQFPSVLAPVSSWLGSIHQFYCSTALVTAHSFHSARASCSQQFLINNPSSGICSSLHSKWMNVSTRSVTSFSPTQIIQPLSNHISFDP